MRRSARFAANASTCIEGCAHRFRSSRCSLLPPHAADSLPPIKDAQEAKPLRMTSCTQLYTARMCGITRVSVGFG
ncbi:hypothetical protein BD414DRAFT_478720, partial [Trametes punicea]